jgi:polyphosphate glucokinase
MQVLVIDVGGIHVKLFATGEEAPREFPSGPTLTAVQMIARVKSVAADWKYEVVSIGYPRPVLNGHPAVGPHNLGPGWVGVDYPAAFGCPAKVVNDAAMQALGSYRGGKLGSTMIVGGIVEPMELGHLPYRDGTFEDHVGQRGLVNTGWRTGGKTSRTSSVV